MLILFDSKMPEAAKEQLTAVGAIVEFATEGITYEAISGHLDIFFCPTPAGLIVAPNLPQTYIIVLNKHHIHFTPGQLAVGNLYPESARYNSLVTERFIIQSAGTSDPSIQKLNPDHELINIRQGYIRCNLIALPNDTFITSDRGIEKSLRQRMLEVLFVDPSPVRLEGFKHGFFGGACGLLENTLFVCGSLKYVKEKNQIENFCATSKVQIVELYKGQPVDVGTILFLSTGRP
jgi:hypothetical protein